MASPVVLPPLVWRSSPNYSSRHGSAVELVVLHETAGAYAGAVSWLRDPRAQASSHFVLREDGREATQLVRLRDKAWTQGDFNPRCVSIELATTKPQGFDSGHQLHVAARMAAWIIREFHLPPRWAKRGNGRGLCYHGELGDAGGGHPYCGPNANGWAYYLAAVHYELDRGGFRDSWAHV